MIRLRKSLTFGLPMLVGGVAYAVGQTPKCPDLPDAAHLKQVL